MKQPAHQAPELKTNRTDINESSCAVESIATFEGKNKSRRPRGRRLQGYNQMMCGYGIAAPLAQLWMEPFCAPVIVPSFFRVLV
jgi:hypothetical protein